MRAALVVSISASDTRLRSPPETLLRIAGESQQIERRRCGWKVASSPSNHLGADPGFERMEHSKGMEKPRGDVLDIIGSLALL